MPCVFWLSISSMKRSTSPCGSGSSSWPSSQLSTCSMFSPWSPSPASENIWSSGKRRTRKRWDWITFLFFCHCNFRVSRIWPTTSSTKLTSVTGSSFSFCLATWTLSCTMLSSRNCQNSTKVKAPEMILSGMRILARFYCRLTQTKVTRFLIAIYVTFCNFHTLFQVLLIHF